MEDVPDADEPSSPRARKKTALGVFATRGDPPGNAAGQVNFGPPADLGPPQNLQGSQGEFGSPDGRARQFSAGAILFDPGEVQAQRETSQQHRSAKKCPARHSRLPISRVDAVQEDATEVIEVSSTSEEDLVNLPLSRGDSVYRGPRVRSRIDSIQTGRDMSPPVTRRAARLRRQTPKAIAVPQDSEQPNALNASRTVVHTNAPSESKVISKRLRQAQAASESDGTERPQKIRKAHPSSSDDSLPTPRRFLQRLQRSRTSKHTTELEPSPKIHVKTSHHLFVDDEAQDADSVCGSSDKGMDVDEYDTDDSFIDDSDIKPKNSWQSGQGRTRGGQTPTPGQASRKSSRLTDDRTSDAVMSPVQDNAPGSISDGELERLLEGIRKSRAAKAAAKRKVGESSRAPRATSTPGSAVNASSAMIAPSTPLSNETGTASLNPSPTANTGSATRKCPPLPSVCQVTNPGLQDPVLASTYKNLVPLIAGELIAWSDLVGPGQVAFSAWAEESDDINPQMAFNAITFVEDANFVNPSRSSPENIDVIPQPGSTTRFHLSRNGHPIIGVSSIFLEQSHLLNATTSGVIQKYIRGIFHSQEWERFVAWICMAFGHRRLHAQLARDALQFSTRPRFDNKNDGYGTVPVYDARGSNFNFHTDLPNVSALPLWSEEVPIGSFAVVGYTCTLYRSGAGKWTLGFNIQWVVIVGTPAENDEEEE
ncbi:hypothetical protein H1R20_g3130, partial [Candolleomyces eurysporus]